MRRRKWILTTFSMQPLRGEAGLLLLPLRRHASRRVRFLSLRFGRPQDLRGLRGGGHRHHHDDHHDHHDHHQGGGSVPVQALREGLLPRRLLVPAAVLRSHVHPRLLHLLQQGRVQRRGWRAGVQDVPGGHVLELGRREVHPQPHRLRSGASPRLGGLAAAPSSSTTRRTPAKMSARAMSASKPCAQVRHLASRSCCEQARGCVACVYSLTHSHHSSSALSNAKEQSHHKDFIPCTAVYNTHS